MNFLAAHKLGIIVGLALTGAAIFFLRKRAGSGGGSSAGVAGAPYDNGVPISPYSDSAAPQFSFDFSSLLPQSSGGSGSIAAGGTGGSDSPGGTTNTTTPGVPRRVDPPVRDLPGFPPPPLSTSTTPTRKTDPLVDNITFVGSQPLQPLSGGTKPVVSLPVIPYRAS